jgi:SAM-dependent methyltransferase
MLEPLGDALLGRANFQLGQRVADIGCGGGWTSRQAACSVGASGCVHGVDITPVLVAEATRRAEAEAIGNLRFSIGDASRFQPDDAPFDRLLSRLGVMFFADPPAAFSHLRSLLVEGGRADFAVWASPQDNVWMSGARAIAAAHIEMPSPDPRAPGPFALADRDHLEGLLSHAGFSSIDIATWNGRMPVGGIGSDARGAADFALSSSPSTAISNRPMDCWFRPEHGWPGLRHDRSSTQPRHSPCRGGTSWQRTVHNFFDEATFTATRVVRDPATRVFQKRPFMQIAQLHLLVSPEKSIAASNRMAPQSQLL